MVVPVGTQNRWVAITLRAVLETPVHSTGPSAVAGSHARTRRLAHPRWLLRRSEVGLFAAVVADYNNSAPGALATAKRLVAPGRLLLTDTATEIVPGWWVASSMLPSLSGGAGRVGQTPGDR